MNVFSNDVDRLVTLKQFSDRKLSRPTKRITCPWCLLRICCLSIEPSILTSFLPEVDDCRRTMPLYTIIILTRLEISINIFIRRLLIWSTILQQLVDYILIIRPLQFDTTSDDFYKGPEIAREKNASTKYLLYTITRYAFNLMNGSVK